MQRSGIDTIKYHTWPRIPMGKWQTHRHHKREPRGQPFPSRWPQSAYKQTRTKISLEMGDFPSLDGDVPRFTSYGVYISQLIWFARASSYVADFNTRNKLLTRKLLKQGYDYHKQRKTFSLFHCQYYDLISKFHVGLKSLLCQRLWKLIFMVT